MNKKLPEEPLPGVVTLAQVGAVAYNGKKAKTYQLTVYPESQELGNMKS